MALSGLRNSAIFGAPLVLVVVIADVLEVQPDLGKGPADFLAVGHGALKDDGLCRAAEMLVRALDVLGDDVAHDLDARALQARVVPLAGGFHGDVARVDLDRGVDQRPREHPALDQAHRSWRR